MRRAAVAVVLALLLPGLLVNGGHGDSPDPHPLHLFGGRERPLSGSESALVVEVYYHALRADEYVVVANAGTQALDLAGWSITDGEGILTFPAGARASPDARIVIAQNSTAYFEDTLRAANFRYGGGNATAMVTSRSFQLNNAGDEVILRDASAAVVDVLAYGSSSYGAEGWSGPAAAALDAGFVARRGFRTVWTDTNGSADWELVRVWSLGQSEHPTDTFDFVGGITVAVTPDEGFGALSNLLGAAEESIDASLYTFSNVELLGAVLAARSRGVRVRILLEGSPVGGITQDEWNVLRNATDAIEFHFLVDNTTLDIQGRYRFQHAKYAVIDNRTVLVSTENWGRSAFPAWDATGSRGWLVAVAHPPLAAYFTRVFEEDFDARRRDVYTFDETTFSIVETPPSAPQPRTPRFLAKSVHGPSRVVPVIGPDTTLDDGTILGAIRAAGRSIHVEMFYAHTAWGAFPNPYLDALVTAARRGVEVRLLLDASWFNVDEDDPIDNDDTVLYLNTVAANEGLDLQAKLVDLEVHGFTQLHAKGFVVDGRTVLVSSVNWNRNSPTANREAGLLVENEEVAAYFEDVFAWDWQDDLTPPVADAGPDRTALVGDPVAFSGLGSSDEVAVTNYSWDLDADGAFDAWGPQISRIYIHPGTFTVRLRVSDASNNSGQDTSVVVVRERSAPAPLPGLTIVVLVGVAAAIVVTFLVLRRRRKGLSKPR
jgi:phosphatidylserine/phosphatidylglycerophosphate/cardiolipin synthase-like enzyme